HESLPAFLGARADVLGGGPMLVAEGSVSVEPEEFPADVTQGRNPRTAIGLGPDGSVLLAAVAGRGAHYSVGMTLTELARFMKDLGARNAMNLDGGSSTTLCVNGRLLDPTDPQDERAVADAVAIIP
ncbi:MAG: phosphodiester glycosidase family protein, partial [Cyanobacteria bacterium REEB65]|nr:phosphodiester glycosidase family protein [Cyanobacteria bacterium REEB65]